MLRRVFRIRMPTFLMNITSLVPWRWKLQNTNQRWYLSSALHGTISQVTMTLTLRSFSYDYTECETRNKLLQMFFTYTTFFFLAQQPNVGQGSLILEFYRSHTLTQHSQYSSSGRGIDPLQRHLITQNSDKRNQRSRRDSNPQSQQAIGRRPSP